MQKTPGAVTTIVFQEDGMAFTAGNEDFPGLAMRQKTGLVALGDFAQRAGLGEPAIYPGWFLALGIDRFDSLQA